MATLGQVSSFWSGGGGVSPTACDFEPKSWPNRSPIDGLEADEPEPNMLPPPQPDNTPPAIASTTRPRKWPVRPAPIVCIKCIVQMSPAVLSIGTLLSRFEPSARWRLITGQWRRTQGAQNAARGDL